MKLNKIKVAKELLAIADILNDAEVRTAAKSYKEYLKGLKNKNNSKFKNEKDYNKAMGIEEAGKSKKKTEKSDKKDVSKDVAKDVADKVKKKVEDKTKKPTLRNILKDWTKNNGEEDNFYTEVGKAKDGKRGEIEVRVHGARDLTDKQYKTLKKTIEDAEYDILDKFSEYDGDVYGYKIKKVDKRHVQKRKVPENKAKEISKFSEKEQKDYALIHKAEVDDKTWSITDKIKESDYSPEFLDYLADNKHEDIRYSVARNKNTSAETLDKLSKDEEDVVVHKFVTRNPNTKVETLVNMAKPAMKNKNEHALWGIADNPKTPTDILDLISSYDGEDENHGEGIISSVAENKNTSTETLDKLSSHVNPTVLKNVIRNKNVSIKTLKKLSKHKQKVVSGMAKKRLNKINKKGTIKIGSFKYE